MRKLALLSTVVAFVIGLAAVPSVAGPPTQLFLEDDITFPSGGLTAACGFPVFVSIQGGIHIMLRMDRNGVLTETDTQSKWALTLSAPTQGTSFSYKFGPSKWVYPEGAVLGGPAIIYANGVDVRYPGVPAEAGRTVIRGEIIDIRPDGVPVADFVEVLSESGNQLPPAETRANLCAALTA